MKEGHSNPIIRKCGNDETHMFLLNLLQRKSNITYINQENESTSNKLSVPDSNHISPECNLPPLYLNIGTPNGIQVILDINKLTMSNHNIFNENYARQDNTNYHNQDDETTPGVY